MQTNLRKLQISLMNDCADYNYLANDCARISLMIVHDSSYVIDFT
jgi:hypothetical protein